MKTLNRLTELYEHLHLEKDVSFKENLEKEIEKITLLVPKEVEFTKLEDDFQKLIYVRNNGASVNSMVLFDLESKINELKKEVDEGFN